MPHAFFLCISGIRIDWANFLRLGYFERSCRFSGAVVVEETSLIVEIKNSNPVELVDLTNSLLALSRQYQRHAVRLEEVSSRQEAKLYIKEMRSGSIIAELTPYADFMKEAVNAVAPYAEPAKKVVEFAKYLKGGIDSLLKGTKPPTEMSARDLKDISQILDVTAKDPGGMFRIIATENAHVQVTINVNSQDSNAVQNQATKNIEAMKEPEKNRYNHQLMYWQTASRGKPSKTNDKATIDAISTRALPVFIEDPEIKKQMLSGEENPFLVGFFVDVEILTVRGEIKAYKIVGLNGTLEDDHPEDIEHLPGPQ